MFNTGVPIRIGPWKANAFSLASRATWLALPSFDLILDIGWCVEPMRQLSRLFLSHLHNDHALALPTWITWRQRFIDTQGPPRVYTHARRVEQTRALISASAAAQEIPLHAEVIGLSDGERVPLGPKRFLEAFETPHRVPTLGCLIYERRRVLEEAFRGREQAEINAAIEAGEDVIESKDIPLLCYTSDTTPQLFERMPKLLDAQVLITECSYLDGVLTYPEPNTTRGERPGITHAHLRPLARALSGFRGEHIVLGHLPQRHAACDLKAFILPRFPPAQRRKLALLPHQATPSARLDAEPSAPPQRTLAPVAIETLDPACWQARERPFYSGWRKAQRHAAYADRYGQGNYQMAWRWKGGLITQRSAQHLYEDAYVAYLSAQPELLEWLVKTAADVYDTHPSNVLSGLDFNAQDPDEPNHYQDIALRRALIRLGCWFEGDHLVEIRGLRSEGYALNPGLVPFHEPDTIIQPEWESSWALPGSVESFWQSNKVLVTRVSSALRSG